MSKAQPAPAYKPGDSFGGAVIQQYLGYYSPGTAAKKHHYLITCDRCGTPGDRHQEQIRNFLKSGNGLSCKRCGVKKMQQKIKKTAAELPKTPIKDPLYHALGGRFSESGGGDVDENGEDCGHDGAQIGGMEIDGDGFLFNGRRSV